MTTSTVVTCKAWSRLRPINPQRFIIFDSFPITVGDLTIDSESEDSVELHVSGQVEGQNRGEAIMGARDQLLSVPFSLTIASGVAYEEHGSYLQNVDSGGPISITGPSEESPVGTKPLQIVEGGQETLDSWREWQPLVMRYLFNELVQYLFLDMRAAAADGTKFSLVHMYRCLDTIRDQFGGWDQMRKALDVNKKTVDFVKRLRSESPYRVAHSASDLKVAYVSESHVLQAFTLTRDIVRRFLEHLGRNTADA